MKKIDPHSCQGNLSMLDLFFDQEVDLFSFGLRFSQCVRFVE